MKNKMTALYAGIVLCLCASVSEAIQKARSTQNTELKISLSRFIGPEDCPGASGFADPYVFKEGEAWYMTSTYPANAPMYMFSTTDFVGKKRYALNVDLNESLLQNHFNDSGLIADSIWGLVPYRHTDDKWHAYGTIHVGYFRTFVCHFSPAGNTTWPITDWKLDKVLVGSPSNSAYESKVYSDASGMYLLYVDQLDDGNNHVVAQRMLDPENLDASFTPRPILSPEGLASEYRNPPGGMQICEGQNISRLSTPKGSKYVMLYSVGDFAQYNYKLGVAYSDTLIPPSGQQYAKPKQSDPKNVWHNPTSEKEVVYLLQTEVESWPNYCRNPLKGPGLGNLVEYRGGHYLLFHSRDPDPDLKGDGRWVWIAPVTVNFRKSMPLWIVPNTLDGK